MPAHRILSRFPQPSGFIPDFQIQRGGPEPDPSKYSARRPLLWEPDRGSLSPRPLENPEEYISEDFSAQQDSLPISGPPPPLRSSSDPAFDHEVNPPINPEEIIPIPSPPKTDYGFDPPVSPPPPPPQQPTPAADEYASFVRSRVNAPPPSLGRRIALGALSGAASSRGLKDIASLAMSAVLGQNPRDAVQQKGFHDLATLEQKRAEELRRARHEETMAGYYSQQASNLREDNIRADKQMTTVSEDRQRNTIRQSQNDLSDLYTKPGIVRADQIPHAPDLPAALPEFSALPGVGQPTPGPADPGYKKFDFQGYKAGPKGEAVPFTESLARAPQLPSSPGALPAKIAALENARPAFTQAINDLPVDSAKKSILLSQLDGAIKSGDTYGANRISLGEMSNLNISNRMERNQPLVPTVEPSGGGTPTVVYTARNQARGKQAPRTLYDSAGNPSTGGQQGISTTTPPAVPDSAQQQIAGIEGSLQLAGDVEKMLSDPESAALGPLMGRIKLFEVNKLGGLGATPKQIALATALQRLVASQAFAEGGKTLTPTELAVFTSTNPKLEDTVEAAIQKTKDSIAFLKKKQGIRLGTMPARQRNQIPTLPSGVGGGSQSSPNAPAVGTIDDGYRFKGGDPRNQANWERVQ